ncbi:MAG: thermonuclease family protein [Candidatus Hadarchaeum sp.]|uniref:thermonuclease family protein n=1 Tax=Candidatus Hadarchaeum sp. TaxID=2883567 RepID=UPI003D0C4018
MIAILALLLLLAWVLVSQSTRPGEDFQEAPVIERSAVVSRVIDGDTIDLEGGEKVRLVGINAPELRSSNLEERELAESAKEFVENFCPPGSKIGLNVDDLEPRDRYGRTLALVYVDVDNVWLNLNAELLRRGLAEILYLPPSEFNPYKWMVDLPLSSR